MSRYCFAPGIVLFVLVAGFGCSPAPKGAAKMHAVKGTVLLDTKPMPEGQISFEVDGFPPATIPIKEGSFSGEAPEGNSKVRISRLEKGVAEKDKPEPGPKNVIPAKWNSQSKLEATVAASGNDYKFEITSK